MKRYDKELLQYVIATREATDSLINREIRNDYLQNLLKGFILRKKDDRRIFDPNIKGVLWTGLLKKRLQPKCPNPDNNPGCRKILTRDDAQVDHIYPWSKGGPTSLKNAQLICSSCNKRKGNR